MYAIPILLIATGVAGFIFGWITHRSRRIAVPHTFYEIINRRAEVEQYLLDCSRDRRSPPTPAVCLTLALRLGTPRAEWGPELKAKLP